MDVEKKFPLFGGETEIVIYDTDENFITPFFDDIVREALRLQKIFNFFDPESELSELNRKRKMQVSPELLEVIKTALKYCRKTKGLYDISIGLKILDRKKCNKERKISCSYKDIKYHENTVSLLHPDVCIDLGSIAKGYISDKIISFMKKNGIESCFIDARGDMRITGKHLEVVEIQHPRDIDKRLYPVILEEKSIATSGDYNQYYQNYSNCHIIGKRDLISVTVIADTLMEADVTATCLFLIGKKDAEEFAVQNRIKAFVIDDDLKKYFFNDFQKLVLEEKFDGK